MNKDNEKIEYTKDQTPFIRQTIKGRGNAGKRTAIRIFVGAVLVILGAVIAAFVFVFTKPIAERLSGVNAQGVRVTIDDDSDDIEMNESPVNDVFTEGTAFEQEVAAPEETAEDFEYVYEANVDDFLKVNSSLMDIANKAKLSMVKVTSFSSITDYFNSVSEKKQQINGLVIAINDESIYVLIQSDNLSSSNRIQVTFTDDCVVDGAVIKTDSILGLSVIRVPVEVIENEVKDQLVCANLGNSYLVNVGDMALAIGAPAGYSDSVVLGRITSKSETASFYDREINIIVTDMKSSSAGNGFLVDMSGQIVGIINQKLDDKGASVVTAIPISQVKVLIEKLTNGDDIAYFGIKGMEVTQEISLITGVPRGVSVIDVDPDTSTFEEGISKSDVIVQIDDETIANMAQLTTALSTHEPNTLVKVKVLRKGAEGYSELEFSIRLGEK